MNAAATPEPARFSRLLGEECCWTLEGAGDKWGVIAALLDRLVECGRVSADRRDAIHAAIVEREKSMSTGMEQGIALPHAAIDGLEHLVTALGVFRTGVPFQSMDGKPARIVVLLLIPRERRLAFLPVLADAARLLAREDVRDRLLAAGSGREAHGILVSAEESSPSRPR